jgi:Methyltransferase domain
MQTTEVKVNSCRLCAGPLRHSFNKIVLQKYDVQYFECTNCGSLQTEEPYWLEEAYASFLSNLDTGAANRNLNNLATVYFLTRLFGAKNHIDFGGGDGLLCRLLRDRGLNSYILDKYAKPAYAQGFTEPAFDPDITTAFEVVEHFVNPSADFDAFFVGKPNLVLVSTELYNAAHGPDWWYFVPKGGQHIFLYTEKAFEIIASKYGYEVVIKKGYILFIKSNVFPSWKLWVARKFRNKLVRRLSWLCAFNAKTPGFQPDHNSFNQ